VSSTSPRPAPGTPRSRSRSRSPELRSRPASPGAGSVSRARSPPYRAGKPELGEETAHELEAPRRRSMDERTDHAPGERVLAVQRLEIAVVPEVLPHAPIVLERLPSPALACVQLLEEFRRRPRRDAPADTRLANGSTVASTPPALSATSIVPSPDQCSMLFTRPPTSWPRPDPHPDREVSGADANGQRPGSRYSAVSSCVHEVGIAAPSMRVRRKRTLYSDQLGSLGSQSWPGAVWVSCAEIGNTRNPKDRLSLRMTQ